MFIFLSLQIIIIFCILLLLILSLLYMSTLSLSVKLFIMSIFSSLSFCKISLGFLTVAIIYSLFAIITKKVIILQKYGILKFNCLFVENYNAEYYIFLLFQSKIMHILIIIISLRHIFCFFSSLAITYHLTTKDQNMIVKITINSHNYEWAEWDQDNKLLSRRYYDMKYLSHSMSTLSREDTQEETEEMLNMLRKSYKLFHARSFTFKNRHLS